MMPIPRFFRLFALLLITLTTPVLAELPEAWKERYIENTVKEVVGKASRDASREVNRRPELGGLSDGGFGSSAFGDASDRGRRALDRLDRDHRREMVQFQKALKEELDVAEAEFRREAELQDSSPKLFAKRKVLESQVEQAYKVFEAHAQQQQQHYGHERQQILEKNTGRDRGFYR